MLCAKMLEYTLRTKTNMTLAFPPLWQEQLKTLGFEQLTEIQERLFEPITQGENVLGVSPTGTGKTLAYLFPSLLKLKP